MKRVLFFTLVLSMLTGAAFAEGGHGAPGGPGGPGGPEDHGFGGPAIVSSDGTVYVTKASATTGSVDVVAIRSTGATAWTATIAGGGHIFLSNSNLITVTDTKNSDGSFTSTITAYSAATGTQAWTLTQAGRVEPNGSFAGGTYFNVIVPPATQGGTPTRSLIAVSNSGALLWSVSL